MRYLRALCLAGFAMGCGQPPPLDYPQDAVTVLAGYMARFVTLPTDATDAGYHVYDLGALQVESFAVRWACDEPTRYLYAACSDIQFRGIERAGCTSSTAQLGNQWSPSCAVRLSLPSADPEVAPRVVTVDLNSCALPKDCQQSAFSGCETVIQRNFQAAGLAVVNATTWTSPRTHVMLHEPVAALRPVDAALCDEAKLAAGRVCDELAATMSFVAACHPYVHFSATPRPACAVRFDVRFGEANPANSVLTTQLDGLLSFRIE
jgi:hypothetical protein